MMQAEATMVDLVEEECELENLPEDMKLEILLCMPIKSLECMKLVSKSWCSRILSNPNFPKLHAQRRSGQRYPNRILLASCCQLRSIDINASLHDDSDTRKLNFRRRKFEDIRLVASCRGIVLLLIKQEQLWLWNPVTGSYKPISLPPHFKYISPFAFCYHEPIDDYFIGLSYNDDPEHTEVSVVLSLRTKSQEKLDLSHHLTAPYPNLGTFFNGAIHFIAYSHGSSTSLHIIAFDVTTKELRRVPCPFFEAGVPCLELGVHKSCLAIAGVGEDFEILVWVMREYGVRSSWTKLISLYCGDNSFTLPIAIFKQGTIFFKQGDEFVITYHGIHFQEGLLKFNSKGELLEYRQYGPGDACIEMFIEYITWRTAIAFTETLLPLP